MKCFSALARRTAIFAGLVSAAFGMVGSASAQTAATYPSKPVTLVVPFTPGGATDILARLAADGLAKELGQPFLVQNVAGAGGIIGAQQVVRAKPDGYTLLAGTAGSITINPVIQKDIPYDVVRDLQPITTIASGPNVLVVGKNSPYKTVKDLVDAARAKPGSMSFGSSGVGATAHLSSALFLSLGNFKAEHVPYKGTAPALVDLIAGRTDFYIEAFPALAGMIDSGQLRPLAVTTPARFPLRPDIPTMQEAGIPNYVGSGWVGLNAPSGVPADIIDKIQKAFARSVKDPEMIKKINATGFIPGGESPAEFGKSLTDERARYKAIVDANNIVVNP